MTTLHTHTRHHLDIGLPVVTRRDIDRFIEEGKRLRAAEGDKLLRAIGRGLDRYLVEPVAAALRATGLPQRLELASMRRREQAKVAAELGTYSERELMGDLRMNRSEIPDVAAAEADHRVAAFVRANPDYRRPARQGRDASTGGLAYAGR